MDARKKLVQSESGQSKQDNLFLDREISLLAFNRRVLAQAEDPLIPLLERLRYLCIVCSNLDEFFEIRIASLLAQARQGSTSAVLPSHDVISQRIGRECHRLVEYQYVLLNRIILPELAKQGVHLLRHEERNAAQRAWVKDYFEREVRPLLTPIGLDPAHPFPQVINKSLNFIIELSGQDPFGRDKGIAIIKAPRVLPRVIRLSDELSDQGISFCLLSSIIHAHIADLFPGREVTVYSQFRVTRNSDLWLEELEGKDLRKVVQSELHSRHFGVAIRLEVSRNCPPHIADFLLSQFSIHPSRLYAVDGPVNLVRLQEMIGYVQQPELHFPLFAPGMPNLLLNADIFSALKSQDILLHHPYQSFEPVIDFVRKAAQDTDVVAIKQTIYRTGMHSDLMEALISAARRGKEVTVIVELMARFDEEANINWAERLERAGAQVIYGVVGLKTHAKLALVLRRENGKLHYYAHLGTGNYHPKTTKLYTDFGLLTAHEGITAEVNEVFIHLASLIRPKSLDYLWLAPFTLQAQLVKAIKAEAAHARQGKRAHIIGKMNGLLDESVICALYEASQAGVKIDLIVRGTCTLRPGVPGLSDNIKVRSIVGRFLEHTRVYYFRDNGAEKLYLSSADWMNRNLARRIEVAFPVLDKNLKKRVIDEGLRPYLKDNANAWELDGDGEYRRRRLHAKTPSFNAQHYLALSMGSLELVDDE
jgi:polyphosphate kinase